MRISEQSQSFVRQIHQRWIYSNLGNMMTTDFISRNQLSLLQTGLESVDTLSQVIAWTDG
jgi:hypothetical protein